MDEHRSQRKYQLSFSTGGLFFNESLLVIDEFLLTQDWQITRESILENNLIQSRTESSKKRRVREICQRLQTLSSRQIQLLKHGYRQEQQYLLWLAVCKHYLLIYEFAVEVMYEKFLRMDLVLVPDDFDRFFNAKADWHDELDELKNSTRAKIRQVVFKIMREAEILSDSGMIIPALPTQELADSILEDNPALLKVFPYQSQR